MKVGDLVRLVKPTYHHKGKNMTGVIIEDFCVRGIGKAGEHMGESNVYKVLTSAGKVEVFLSGWIEKIESIK